MVVSKDGKRKRKDSSLVDSSPEIPKRLKIQAQRKFAQGQGNQAASIPTSAATIASSSQLNSQVRGSKDSISAELIPHKKPSAEDLVTYICFRGTPGLPPHLDIFNQGSKYVEEEKDKVEVIDEKTIYKIKPTRELNKNGDQSKKMDKCSNETRYLGLKGEKQEASESIGYAVRKRAEKISEGNRKLRNDDRVTRLRQRAPQKIILNRRSPRTRSGLNNKDNKVEFDEDEDSIVSKTNKGSVQRKVVSSAQKGDDLRNSSVAISDKESNSNLGSKINANKKYMLQPEGVKNQIKPDNQLSPGRDHALNAFPKEGYTSILNTLSRSLSDRREMHPIEKQDSSRRASQILPGANKSEGKSTEKSKKVKGRRKNSDSQISNRARYRKSLKRNIKETFKLMEKNNLEPVESKSSHAKRGKKSLQTFLSKNPKASRMHETENKEIEKRSSRPMRKTKEAATIYMEWIGLKLNLDDDGSSLDSFPELPNAKETQKIENELKCNSLKEKESVKKKNQKSCLKRGNAKILISSSEMEAIKETKETNFEIVGKLEKVNITKCRSEKKSKSYSNSDDEPLATQKTEKKSKNLQKGRGRRAKMKIQHSLKKKVVVLEEIEKSMLLKRNKEKLISNQINQSDTNQFHKVTKLEKNFSDSDDEPLATKLIIKSLEAEAKNIPDPLQIITEITPVTVQRYSPPDYGKRSLPSNLLTYESMPTLEESSSLKADATPKYPIKPPLPPLSAEIQSVITSRSKADCMTLTPIMPIPVISTSEHFTSPERFPSPKVNPSFLTPKFDRNLERKLPVEIVISTLQKNSLPSPSLPKLDISSTKSASPISGVPNIKKYEPDPILSANLMPSKEESGKIFGIASVSLAQSSGPDNTKCTLGKCGSIHKPALGPVVPTEAYLGEPLSSKERRKAKVNMTHEQIQRWLVECSSNPDEIQDDLEDDFEEPLKPKMFAPTPPLMREEAGSVGNICKDIRTENAWSGKGPSLKATPVFVKESSREKMPICSSELAKFNAASDLQNSLKPRNVVEIVTTEKSFANITFNKKTESFAQETTKSPKPSTSSATSSPKRLSNPKIIACDTQKKLIVPKRHLVYSSKPASNELCKKIPLKNFSAFSPENETSVYSFDKEDDVLPPLSRPFRRHSRRDSNTDENASSEKPVKTEKLPPQEIQQNSVSLMLSPEENAKSIKVCLENTESVTIIKSGKPQVDTLPVGDSDSESHTFYIPLQSTGIVGANSDKSDTIQGVAVKLGREGPEGPNQRVIMHATLVTKSQMGSNPTPIPESMNVHEIVKNLLSSNKEMPALGTSKSVPIGTVQPRFKSNPDVQLVSESNLTRVNSNSSLLSGSTKSKAALLVLHKKHKSTTPIKMSNNTAFPRRDDPTQMVEAPIFRPTDKEFQDPMDFIDRITPIAARFGICKIIPPESFKPECRVSDDMRFTAYNQYIHKMLHRWGPSAKEFCAIKKYLATQSISMAHPPWIGGMEVDLPRLYHTVQELGGLKEVIEKKKWARVAEEMCIPKLAQDRVTKLDDIYCKYLLPYDTLSPIERQKLFDEVEADWAKREARARRNADRCVNLESISHEDEESSENEDESDEEIDGVSMECIIKGRSMPLNAFFRIARNTMALWFKNTEPTVADIEAEFWRHVAVRDSHVCVHSGSIDSSGWGYGFPTPGPKAKGSPCAKHPWNLKVLTNNSGSMLRSLGPVMGVTVPTLHVGMLFSACCWYRDPHGLSWIEYLHTGASKIWYGIPDEQSSKFRTALTALIPTHCQNKTIWLPCDTVMVPPHMLTDRGVSLCRVEQKPGEYVVIFPRAYTSSIATGYVVSESVYFATSSWLDSAKDDFKDMHESCEPAMFSLEQLLFAIANDQRVTLNILSQIVPMLNEVYHKEAESRQQLKVAGVTQMEKFPFSTTKTKQKLQQLPEEHECDLCRANLYISMVKTTDGNIYCLQHALRIIKNGNIQAEQCILVFTYDIEDIKTLIKKIQDRLGQSQKKSSSISGTGKKSK